MNIVVIILDKIVVNIFFIKLIKISSEHDMQNSLKNIRGWKNLGFLQIELALSKICILSIIDSHPFLYQF